MSDSSSVTRNSHAYGLNPGLSRMRRTVKTPGSRVASYGRDVFTVKRDEQDMMDKLFCKPCNVFVDHTRKSSVDQHILAKCHKSNLMFYQAQQQEKEAALEERERVAAEKEQDHDQREGERVVKEENESDDTAEYVDAKPSSEEFYQDLILAFAAADIPLEKLNDSDLRSFFNKYLKGGLRIPSMAILRKILPSVYNKQMKTLNNLMNSSFMPVEDTMTIYENSV